MRTKISIHAPLRERPVWYDIYKHSKAISIHAPLRERRAKHIDKINNFLFQSTLPYGSDGVFMFLFSAQHRFQSTLPYGSDTNHANAAMMITKFQSTLPYGSDCLLCCSLFWQDYFNPRSLTGATFGTIYTSKTRPFQSTLPYGSDRFTKSTAKRYRYFNPRSLTGATSTDTGTAAHINISIHAPLRERLW